MVKVLIIMSFVGVLACKKDVDPLPLSEEPKEEEEWSALDLFSNSLFVDNGNIDINIVANGNSWDTFTLDYFKDISRSRYGYCHPDVEYFENGFKGYKYWMAFTPYFGTIGSSGEAINYENPSVVVSNDGLSWIEPRINMNPIQMKPSIKDGTIRNEKDTLQGYWSDTDLLYRNNQLEIFYRGSGVSVASFNRFKALSANNDRKLMKPAVRTIVKQVSQNGVNWDPLEILYTSNEPETINNNDILSPSFVLNKNMIFSYEVLFNTGMEGYGEDDNSFVLKRTSSNGLDFTNFRNSKMVHFTSKPWKDIKKDYSPWHIQACYVDDVYYLLLAVGRVKSYSSEALYIAYSKDGDSFEVFPKPIVSSGGYRSCIFSLANNTNEIEFGAIIGMKTGRFTYRKFKMNKRIMNKILTSNNIN